jgi:hypothetical protein
MENLIQLKDFGDVKTILFIQEFAPNFTEESTKISSSYILRPKFSLNQ